MIITGIAILACLGLWAGRQAGLLPAQEKLIDGTLGVVMKLGTRTPAADARPSDLPQAARVEAPRRPRGLV